jgi:hypothetical protein
MQDRSQARIPGYRTVAALLLGVGTIWAQTANPGPGPAKKLPAAEAPPSVSSGLYHNPAFGFVYKTPFGWVDRTAEMREGDAGQDSTDRAKAEVLLGVFERPPETTGNTVNSAVVIAVESVSSYPGLKTAADYFGPLDEVITAKGFKVVNEPYAFPVGTKQLARSDFSKDLDKLTLEQATLVMVERGSVVSFTFIGGSQDEVDGLIEGLRFLAAHRSAGAPASPPKK